MENEQNPPKKEKSKLFIISAFVGVLLLIAFGFYYSLKTMKEKDAESDKNKSDYVSMLLKYQNASRYSDSLYKVNMRFDKYRHSAEWQAFRDSISRRLTFEVGDYAFKKLDQSKVLITDVVVGGGLYDYYFRYRIQDSSGVETEIKPELLYSKDDR